MAKAFSMTIDIPGVEVWVNYNAANLRITTVQWTLPQKNTAWVRIWNSGLLVVNRTIIGPENGAENIPGNHQVELREGIGGIMVFQLPSQITYSINIETAGS